MTATQHSPLWNVVYPRDLFWALFSISYTHHPLPISLSSTRYGIISTLMIPSCIYLLKLTVAMISHWAKRRVECCANDLDCWMVNKGLKLNQEKTELVLITSQFRSRPTLEFIQVGDEKIDSTQIFLPGIWGLTIDHCLNLTEHVKKMLMCLLPLPLKEHFQN